jgi:glycerol-3-phosphate acyltransferase PlsY
MLVVLILAAYLSGSIIFAKIVGDHHGVDLRSTGSGNPGFANAVRVLGFVPALPILAGDVLKGYIPAAIGVSLLPSRGAMLVAIAAVLGHLFPIWYSFRGGKGVATGLGVLLALSPGLGLPVAAIYLTSLATFRQSAPSSLLAAWSSPLLSMALGTPYTWGYLFLAGLITYTHRANITRLHRPARPVA